MSERTDREGDSRPQFTSEGHESTPRRRHVSDLVPPDLWRRLTSTVGLVCARHSGGINVMAAEWSYFVNRNPLYAAVVLAPGSASRELIEQAGEFSLTLCSADQAAFAAFAGSFSVTDVDKSSSESLRLRAPVATKTPWADGGVVALECVLRDTVPFPVHTMYVGEVVAAHLPERPLPPLVKHGGMYHIGAPVPRTEIVVAAQFLPGNGLRVAATGPAGDGEWRLTLWSPDGRAIALGDHAGAAGLMLDLPLPAGLVVNGEPGWRLRVEKDGAVAGHASVAGSQLFAFDS